MCESCTKGLDMVDGFSACGEWVFRPHSSVPRMTVEWVREGVYNDWNSGCIEIVWFLEVGTPR